jgi:hypothetical protein
VSVEQGTRRSDDIENRFGFHPATAETGPQHDAVRAKFRALAHDLSCSLPNGRHQSLALTALQEAMMWSNAAIACDTPPSEAPSHSTDSTATPG